MASPPTSNPHNRPCPTPTYHTDTYPFISPRRPQLSQAGRRAIITGGGTGIGRATVLAFAEAGASEILVLGGRREAPLEETRALVAARFPATRLGVAAVDITDAGAVRAAVEGFGGLGTGGHGEGWDVLVLNSGYMADKGPMVGAGIGEWWRSFEVNVKGNLILLQALLPSRREGAAVLATSSLVINFGELYGKMMSSYTASKFALTSMMELLAAENGDLHVVSYHPGAVDTDMLDKHLGKDAVTVKAETAFDKVELPAHFAVWLASQEARFLRGKFVWANWDMPELIESYSERIRDTDFLTVNVQGWPFSPGEI